MGRSTVLYSLYQPITERVGKGGKDGGLQYCYTSTTVIHLDTTKKDVRTRLADNQRTRNGRLNNETRKKPEKIEWVKREKSNGESP